MEIAIAVLCLCLPTLTLTQDGETRQWSKRYSCDFRSSGFDFTHLRPHGISGIGQFVRPASDGLHLIVPRSPTQWTAIPVMFTGRVSGDFEIQLRYKLLHTKRLKDTEWIAPMLWIQTETEDRQTANVRLHLQGKDRTLVSLLERGPESEPVAVARQAAVNDYGTLRLVRTNDRLLYSARDGDGPLLRLQETELSPNDVLFVRLSLESSSPVLGGEVVLESLEIAADGLQSPGEGTSRFSWTAIAAMFVVCAAVAGVGVWRRYRA